ncbi:type 1 glutamine amidotransferase [Roseibium aggregatum]|uniref:Type 1 glutamine amidotransferase n=1 Tax=Roseibium aggregatum TaxID=187304 RepID=A0A939J200_9HYPH|nr:type 1 glutamine amidotransferase [Roseibium aggregatum]MBN9669012.1 type 1 glutamine amidotransferase [Roseibium aggregatum]
MDFLVIENYRGTDLGLMGRVAAADGFRWHTVSAWQGEAVPEAAGAYRGLVVLGGAQDALADDDYPFLPEVCALIRAFHRLDRPVLGICLGSQLIARAFGGGNVLGRPVEFGWQAVVPTEEGRSDPVLATLEDGAPLFHWHSDTVTLPEGAVHLAQSDMTPVQAFRLGRATYAIQFHFETGLEDVRRWSETFPDDIRVHTPDWDTRFETEAARHASEADATGTALSRAWLSLL